MKLSSKSISPGKNLSALFLSAISLSGVVFHPTASAAEEVLASIDLSQSESFQIPRTDQNCTMSHSIEEGYEQQTFVISSSEPVNRLLRIDIRTGAEQASSELRLENASLSYHSLSLSGIIVLEAEANFESLSDDEYYALHDQAEAVEGQDDPSFDSFVATVDGVDFLEYAKRVRSEERFPAMRTETVSVSLNEVPVNEVMQEETYEYATVQYSGPCNITLMLE